MAFVLQFYCSYGVNKSECRGLKGRNRLKSPLIRLYSRLFFVIHGCGRKIMVPMTGLEPVRYCYRGILSPLRLPIPPHQRMDGGGFEPPKQFAADLQSVPFGHSGIHPC